MLRKNFQSVRKNWKKWIFQFAGWIIALWRDEWVKNFLYGLGEKVNLDLSQYFFSPTTLAFLLLVASIVAILIHERWTWLNKTITQTVSVFIGMLLIVILYIGVAKLVPAEIGGIETPPPETVTVPPTEPSPTPDLETQAEEVVRNYYDLIAKEMFDEAELLLDPVLLSNIGGRAGWENEGRTHTYLLPNTFDTLSNGDVYRVWIDGLVSTYVGRVSNPPAFYTFCVIHFSGEGLEWIIRDLHDEKESCW